MQAHTADKQKEAAVFINTYTTHILKKKQNTNTHNEAENMLRKKSVIEKYESFNW